MANYGMEVLIRLRARHDLIELPHNIGTRQSYGKISFKPITKKYVYTHHMVLNTLTAMSVYTHTIRIVLL